MFWPTPDPGDETIFSRQLNFFSSFYENEFSIQLGNKYTLMYSLEGLQHDCHHALLQLSEHTVGKVLADFAVYATDDAVAKLNVT